MDVHFIVTQNTLLITTQCEGKVEEIPDVTTSHVNCINVSKFITLLKSFEEHTKLRTVWDGGGNSYKRALGEVVDAG